MSIDGQVIWKAVAADRTGCEGIAAVHAVDNLETFTNVTEDHPAHVAAVVGAR
jgi:hypothetical protein